MRHNLHAVTMAVLCSAGIIIAAEKGPWLLDIDANVTLTQNAYSESWIGSESGALSWASRLNVVAEKQMAPLFNQRNTLKLAYGQTKNQLEDDSWTKFAKSTDLIDFETLERLTLDKWLEPFVAFRLISQFVDERDSNQTHYANPMDLFESFGVSRALVAKDAVKWNARLGGAVNQSIDRFFLNPETGHHESRTINNAGLEFVTELKTKAREGMLDYSSLLTVFEALVSSESDKDDDSGTPDWQYPDINWENILSVNITKYVMINLTVQLLYDREKHENVRVKEVLALGLTYKFNNAPTSGK